MPYRNKTFVSFDGDTDIRYYRLMQAWKQNDGLDFNFYDAHDLNYARDSSLESSIKAQLSERLRNSRLFVLLIGEKTRYLQKFVRWEIEQAIARDLPIIGVNLNGRRAMDVERCPPVLQTALAVHVSFNMAIVQHAMDNWPATHEQNRGALRSGPFYYSDHVYTDLGL
jgi:hypothetical protein